MAKADKRPDTAQLIVDELGRVAGPLSAYDLLDRLRPAGISAPLTIYRALGKLVEAGKVHRLESMNAFVACRGHDHASHQHLATGFTICEKCGTVAEFEDPLLRDRIAADAAASRFRPRASVVEIRGVCAACDTPAGHG